MKIKDAINMICPLNNNPCLIEKCPKWEFTKIRNIYVYEPKNSCKCGKQREAYRLCWDCGEVATPEYAHIARKEEDLGPLSRDEQEGKCNL